MRLRWGAFACAWAFASACQAQTQPLTPSDPAAALRLPPESPDQLPDPGRPAPTPPADPVAQASFVLTSVTVEGAAAVPPARLQPAWSPLVGKPVSLADLRAVAARVEAIYADEGYPFVAVVVPPQEVAGGVVRLQVVEGRISDLTVLGLDPAARRQATLAFQPLVEQSPLSREAVESAYQRARDIPGLTVSGALRRGSRPGGMDLVVQARRETWRGYLNVNNLYSKPVGPWGALVGADFYGASAYGDRTSVQLYSTIDWGEQQVLRLSHDRRLNAEGTELGLSFLTADSEPGDFVAPLQLATDATIARAELSHPILARGWGVVRGELAYDYIDQATAVFSDQTLTEDRLRVVSARVFGTWQGGRRAANWSLEYRKGLKPGDASRRGDALISRPEGDPQALVVRLNGDLESAVWRDRLAVFARFEGQWSNAPLLSPEEYAFGNLTIGRGYDPGAAFGDKAAAVALELRHRPLTLPRGVLASPFVFYDGARLWNADQFVPERWLASAGVGVRFDLPRRGRLELTWARPIHALSAFDPDEPPDRLLVNLTFAWTDFAQRAWDRTRRRSPE